MTCLHCGADLIYAVEKGEWIATVLNPFICKKNRGMGHEPKELKK